MRKFLLPLFLLGCLSCTSQEMTETPSDSQLIKLSGGTTGPSCSLDSLWANVESIPLENSTIPVGEIDKVYITENDIIVLDKNISKAVHFFDRMGKFKYTLAKSGKGPGEFIQIQDISYDPFANILHLYDRAQEKIIMFSLEGEFLKEKRFEYYFASFEVCGEGRYAMYKSTYEYDYVDGITDQNYHLIITDFEGRIETGYFIEKPEKEHKPIQTLRFFSAFDKKVSFSSFLSNDIFIIQGEDLAKSFSRDFGDKTVPEELYPITKNEFAHLKANYYFGITNLSETRNHLFFSYRGKYDGVTNVLYNKKSGRTRDCQNRYKIDYSLYPVLGVLDSEPGAIITHDHIHEIINWPFVWEGKIGAKMKKVADWAESTENFNPVLFLFYPGA